MSPIYFTATGTDYYYGNEYFKPGMKLRLIKEPDNKADRGAARVELEGLGRVGCVANSPHSVIGDSYSARRFHGKVGGATGGEVLHILPQGMFCTLVQEEEGKKSSLPRNAMRPKK